MSPDHDTDDTDDGESPTDGDQAFAPSVDQLADELSGDIQHTPDFDRLDRRADDALFASPRDTVRLVALIATALTEPHLPSGRALINGLEATLGHSYSPGTVYPILHDLDDEGLLTKTEYVRTKAYTIADPDAVDALLADYERDLVWYLDAVRAARDHIDAETTDESDPASDADADADA